MYNRLIRQCKVTTCTDSLGCSIRQTAYGQSRQKRREYKIGNSTNFHIFDVCEREISKAILLTHQVKGTVHDSLYARVSCPCINCVFLHMRDYSTDSHWFEVKNTKRIWDEYGTLHVCDHGNHHRCRKTSTKKPKTKMTYKREKEKWKTSRREEWYPDRKTINDKR